MPSGEKRCAHADQYAWQNTVLKAHQTTENDFGLRWVLASWKGEVLSNFHHVITTSFTTLYSSSYVKKYLIWLSFSSLIHFMINEFSSSFCSTNFVFAKPSKSMNSPDFGKHVCNSLLIVS